MQITHLRRNAEPLAQIDQLGKRIDLHAKLCGSNAYLRGRLNDARREVSQFGRGNALDDLYFADMVGRKRFQIDAPVHAEPVAVFVGRQPRDRSPKAVVILRDAVHDDCHAQRRIVVAARLTQRYAVETGGTRLPEQSARDQRQHVGYRRGLDMLQRLLVDDGRRTLVFLIIRHDDHLRELVRLFFEYDHQGFRATGLHLDLLVDMVQVRNIQRIFRSLRSRKPKLSLEVRRDSRSEFGDDHRGETQRLAVRVPDDTLHSGFIRLREDGGTQARYKKGYEYQSLHLSPRHSIPVPVYGPAPLSGTGITELSEHPGSFPDEP